MTLKVDPLWAKEDAADFFRTTPEALAMQRYRGLMPGALGIKVGSRILYDPDTCRDWVRAQLDAGE